MHPLFYSAYNVVTIMIRHALKDVNKLLTIEQNDDIMNVLHNYIFLFHLWKNTLVKVRFPFFRFTNGNVIV